MELEEEVEAEEVMETEEVIVKKYIVSPPPYILVNLIKALWKRHLTNS